MDDQIKMNKDVDLKKQYFFAYIGEQPFCFTISTCDDIFIPIFSTKDSLVEFLDKPHVKKMIKTYHPNVISLKVVTDFIDFFKSINEMSQIMYVKHRIMIDPIETNSNHRKWHEVFFENDEYLAKISESIPIESY